MATFLFWQKPAFRYPLNSGARTAVLVPWFRSTDSSRVFENGWSVETTRFAPGAVAGTREQLLNLAADAAVRLTHTAIALARPGDALLTNVDRDLLWRRFKVPVFEQIIGGDGELLAAECEAHDGLHIEATQRDWTEYRVELSPCACGKTTPRLLAAAPAKLAAAS